MRSELSLILFAGLVSTAFVDTRAAAQTEAVEGSVPPVPAERPRNEPEAAGANPPAGGTGLDAAAVEPESEGGEAQLETSGESPPDETVTPGTVDAAPPTPDMADVPLPAPRPAMPAEAMATDADPVGAVNADAGADTPASSPGATGSEAPEAVVPPSNGLQPAAPTTEELQATTLEVTPEEAVRAAAAIEDAKVCEAELTARGVKFSVGQSISEGDCGVLRPVSVEALSSGVTVSPRTQVLCRTALALDEWVTGSVAGSAAANFDGAELLGIRTASSYVCRSRVGGAKISEHARGSAVDIVTFVFDGGREVAVEAQAAGSPEATFQRDVRRAACGPFKTVLGPGSNADHATHFHFDLAARNDGATYCR